MEDGGYCERRWLLWKTVVVVVEDDGCCGRR